METQKFDQFIIQAEPFIIFFIRCLHSYAIPKIDIH